jgi:hypothetical protein
MVTENQTRDDMLHLNIKREYGPAVVEFMQSHITELPQGFRNDLNNQIRGWGDIGTTGGTVGGGTTGGQRAGSAR